jgi:hypothetical protein
MSIPVIAQAAGADPAGGAAIGEVIIATTAATIVTVALALTVIGHRTERIAFLGRLSAFAERSSGIPGWASLPIAVITGSLVIAVIGMYWDIALHIDEGRDAGPLANPAHYFILIGLFGIMVAGAISMALPRERPSATAVRIREGWEAPLGGVLVFACAAFALSGFPLDDIWHRIFGQDVTLWGPTHLMLIGGATLSTLATAMLLIEGLRARGETTPRDRPSVLALRRAGVAGAFLIGLSTFQAEFDFAVPQFNLLFHPILLMLAAGIGLVSARVWIGRGGALLAVAIYLAVRGLLALLVGPVLGQSTLHLPLYLVEAVCVELVALRGVRRPVVFGVLAGAAIGVIGLAAEWGWSYVFMTISWPSELLPEGAILGFVAAVAGGALGGGIGRALAAPEESLRSGPRFVLAAAGIAAVAVIAYPLPVSEGEPVSATVTLDDVEEGADDRAVEAAITLDPPDAVEEARWFNVTAWQGGGSVVDDLEEVGPGQYETTEPIPVHGNWKSTLRLHSGREIRGLPIFLPEDPAIPAPEVPAEQVFTREFIRDKELLQREQKEDVPGWLTTSAYLTVLAISVSLIAALAWGLGRLDRDRERRSRRVVAASGS